MSTGRAGALIALQRFPAPSTVRPQRSSDRSQGGGESFTSPLPKTVIKLSHSSHVLLRRATLGACALVFGVSTFQLSAADPAPAVAAPTAKQVIDVRRALFTLIGSNFRPVGDALQGKIPYDAADLQKRVARVAFLTPQLSEVFPDFSATGETKAKPEIWSNRADFDGKLKDFQTHVLALAQVVEKDAGNVDAFKAAAAAVGKDCKGCHDDYKSK